MLQLTTIASSHQNGPAERGIRSVNEGGRALLTDSQMPLELWDEAVEHDVYVRNRTDSGPKRNGQPVSPTEAYTGDTPSIDHIRRWGSVCFYFVDRKSIPAGERRDKFVNPGRIGVYVGHSEKTTRHCKVYSPERGSTIKCSVVKVDETRNGGTIDLKLRIPDKPQGTPNTMKDRKPRGRPSKETRKSLKSPLSESTMFTPPLIDSELTKSGTKAEVVIPVEPQPRSDVALMREEDMRDAETPDMTPLEPPQSPSPKRKRSHRANPKNKKRARSDSAASEPEAGGASNYQTPSVDDISAADEATAKTSAKTTEAQAEESTTLNQEPPRYFTRSTRKRDDDDIAGRDPKRFKAFIAKILEDDVNLDLDVLKGMLGGDFETAFPAEVIAGVTIPRTHDEALSDEIHAKHWKAAMAEEMLALHSNNTFREVVLPKGANLVSCKWVFTIKTHTDGSIERYKARLVARGFSQVLGEDYNETFAPTVRMDTLRMFLATVASEDLECYQWDIKNAFTESKLKETIYLDPPKNLGVKKGLVWQALRSLYGLKQAARDWNKLLLKELKSWGFVQSLADPCLFTHPDKTVKLLVYVDDIVASAKMTAEIQWFNAALHRRFNTKPLGEINKILGARVTRDRANRTLYLDQEQYITSMLEKFGFTVETHTPRNIPAADYENLRLATDKDVRINVSEFQQAIGSLMYAMIFTRPDIAFVVGKLSQSMSDPAKHHGHALKHLFRYLKSTASQKLRYGPGGEYKHLVVYSDADWASDKVDRKSVSGCIVMFYGGPISWSSKKQRSVATSSCESEYIALASCAKQGQWAAQVFRDMGYRKFIGKDHRCVHVLGDNQGAIALTKNPQLHERSKHIDICYHFIRDLVEQNRCKITFVPTANMVADGMTKPLPRVKFDAFREQMGVEKGSACMNK